MEAGMSEHSEAGAEQIDCIGEVPAEPAVRGSLALAFEVDVEAGEQPLEDDDLGRRRRRSRARARTISLRRLGKAELNRGRALYPEEDYWRPTNRAECAEMERPCPF